MKEKLPLTIEKGGVDQSARLRQANWDIKTAFLGSQVGVDTTPITSKLPLGEGMACWCELRPTVAVRYIQIGTERYFVTVATQASLIEGADGENVIAVYRDFGYGSAGSGKGAPLEILTMPRTRSASGDQQIIRQSRPDMMEDILDQKAIICVVEDLRGILQNI